MSVHKPVEVDATVPSLCHQPENLHLWVAALEDINICSCGSSNKRFIVQSHNISSLALLNVQHTSLMIDLLIQTPMLSPLRKEFIYAGTPSQIF